MPSTSTHDPAATVHRDIGGAVDIAAAGERFTLLPHRAAYWPRTRTLIVADLHLGKEQVARAAGIPLPDALADEALARLIRAVALTDAIRVMVVGDLIHAAAGLTDGEIDRVASALARLRDAGTAIAVVPGNHDRALGRVVSAWGLEMLAPRHVEHGVAFVHNPADVSGAEWTWCGHVHPVVTLPGRTPVRVPCFIVGERIAGGGGGAGVCVLPSFTAFSSGVTAAGIRGDRFPIVGGRVIGPPLREGARATANGH